MNDPHNPFFRSAPNKWNFVDFGKFRQYFKAKAPRQIKGLWISELQKIQNCDKCCHGERQNRATNLLRAASKTHVSDQSLEPGTNINASVVNQSPQPSTNINASVVNHVSDQSLEPGTNINASVVNQSPQPSTNINASVVNQPPQSSTNVNASIINQLPQINATVIVRSATDNRSTEESDHAPPTADPSTLDTEFRSVYQGFEASQKWRLAASNRFVEDVLYEAFCDKQTPLVASWIRNWTIDLHNPTMEGWFSSDEWTEIKKSVPVVPELKETFLPSLVRFRGVQTVHDLRKALGESYLPKGVAFDRGKHFDAEWVDVVVRQFMLFFDSPDQPLGNSHLEGWFSGHIWSHIGSCMLSIPRISFESKEGTCQASALRKNRKRVEPFERMKSGPRLDGIIRSLDDNTLEFGGMEVARTSHGGTSSTKLLNDTRKLGKALRDMLGRLCQVAVHESVRGQLQVVGFIAAGLVLDHASGLEVTDSTFHSHNHTADNERDVAATANAPNQQARDTSSAWRDDMERYPRRPTAAAEGEIRRVPTLRRQNAIVGQEWFPDHTSLDTEIMNSMPPPSPGPHHLSSMQEVRLQLSAIWLETTGGDLLLEINNFFGVDASHVLRLLTDEESNESGSYTGDEDSEE
ncbi:hypothetical protein FN846DRAFT_911897 [Sphaerosporella brunnea]|uniref:Uncharacterized protein n=1 Tax=Sphaerosporella brunnea TaxID=1250544 RepID=A0A5J5EJF4_9PEZI|nr:hypothetical protein FN846DRAFT_911897 [Sphaerosporella brunnea]